MNNHFLLCFSLKWKKPFSSNNSRKNHIICVQTKMWNKILLFIYNSFMTCQWFIYIQIFCVLSSSDLSSRKGKAFVHFTFKNFSAPHARSVMLRMCLWVLLKWVIHFLFAHFSIWNVLLLTIASPVSMSTFSTQSTSLKPSLNTSCSLMTYLNSQATLSSSILLVIRIRLQMSWGCAMVWMFVPLSNSSLIPKCDGFWRWGFWEVSGSWGWSPPKWVPLIRRNTRDLPLSAVCPVRTQGKD